MDSEASKVIIFGNSGSGKSTLAKRMAAEHNLAHLDLDTLAWEATKPPSRKPFLLAQQAISNFIQNHDRWVIEGCYTDLLGVAAESANQAIFMDLSVEQCQQNAKNRPWEPHKYSSKAAQDNNLNMLLDWIAHYETRTDDFSKLAHTELLVTFEGEQWVINSNSINPDE